jgi:hypothetical protein
MKLDTIRLLEAAALSLASLSFATVGYAQTSIVDLANGKGCPVTLDGKRSGAFVFSKVGNGLQVQIYRSSQRAPYDILRKAPPGVTLVAAIAEQGKSMQNEGVHPVKIDGEHLKFDNGLGADLDLTFSAGGTTIGGKAYLKSGGMVLIEGFCGN